MDILATIAVITVILFVIGGFAAILIDQRAQARHYEQLYVEEHRDNRYLADRVAELRRQLREELKKQKHTV